MESSSQDTLVDATEDSTPDARAESHGPRTILIRRKSVVVGFLVSMACVAMAYGVGRLQGAMHVADIEGKAAEATHKSEARARALETELAASRAKLMRLEASRQLYLSLVALDQRNFGIAQEHLHKASKLLVQSGPPPGAALAQIAKGMADDNLVATENISGQRDQLLCWATEIDALAPPPAP
jgi:hypothetical protein